MKRSHSRHSYPYDKHVTKASVHCAVPGFETSTVQRNLIKTMHRKKQRQNDKLVAAEREE